MLERQDIVDLIACTMNKMASEAIATVGEAAKHAEEVSDKDAYDSIKKFEKIPELLKSVSDELVAQLRDDSYMHPVLNGMIALISMGLTGCKHPYNFVEDIEIIKRALLNKGTVHNTGISVDAVHKTNYGEKLTNSDSINGKGEELIKEFGGY